MIQRASTERELAYNVDRLWTLVSCPLSSYNTVIWMSFSNNADKTFRTQGLYYQCTHQGWSKCNCKSRDIYIYISTENFVKRLSDPLLKYIYISYISLGYMAWFMITFWLVIKPWRVSTVFSGYMLKAEVLKLDQIAAHLLT